MENTRKKMKLIETFDNASGISLVNEQQIVETSNKPSRVDGKYIIGMIEGQFFQPDGMSRNKRWYPRSLWEKALNSSDVKNRLLTSTMFGEIGHSDGPVEDMTLRNGCASHFIDDLWIDDKGRGMGRVYILNTPTGNLLKTYLGAGCKLKVSTRGEGLYKEDCYHDGCPVIDDDTYELQTVDFVLNPGFLETSAVLKEQYEALDKIDKKNIQETIAHVKKEGELRMTLDMNAYVQELKDKVAKLEAKNESLSEELKAKDKELLEKQFVESAEIKKINEEYAPFKKMKVSAKTLTETLKRSQGLLKTAKSENAKLREELKKFTDKCGSLEQIDEATNLSNKALSTLSEYQKLGSIKDIKKLMAQCESMVKEIREAKKLKENVEKVLPKLKESKELEAYAKRAYTIIERYMKTVGTLKQAKSLKESKKLERVSKPSLSEVTRLSKKYNSTVESTAKLVKKYGSKKAESMLETASKRNISKSNLKSGKSLLEEVAQMDKVGNVPAEKDAKSFLSTGMVNNYFNHDALGKEMKSLDLNNIPATKEGAAKDLLKKYTDKIEVEKAPTGLEKEKTPAEAEKEANKLLKK